MNTTQTLTLYHGSHEQIGEIVSGGAWDRFGGVFAAVERRIAESHGPRVHVVEVDPDLVALRRDLRDEFADDDVTKAVEQADVPASMVEFALTDTPPDDCDGEFGWDVQMYRGRIARALGLQAVSMRDEHGTTYLVLPGVAIREID